MSEPERLDLTHPRDVGPLLGDALAIYVRNFPTVFAVSAAIVVPVQLIVSGLGLEELTASYRESPATAEILVPTAVSFLVVVPLIAAATIHVLQTLAAGQRPRPLAALQAGLDLFTPVFVAVLLAGLAIALGLTLLILPGIYLAVRLFFVAQAVVIDGARSTDALRRSWSVSDGSWWRIFAVALLANLIAFLPGTLIVAPFESFAESADRQAISLAGMILTEILTAPFVALVSTLLYHDLRARRMRPK